MALTSPKTSHLKGNEGKKVAIYMPDINTSKTACISLKIFHESQWISFIFVIVCQITCNYIEVYSKYLYFLVL